MVQWCGEALFGEERALAADRPAERFAATAAVPAMSVGSLCTFACTTLRVLGAAPFEVGNVLLDFLETQAASRITKINYRKLTIKAEVSGSIGQCSTKLRVCQREGGICYVEFQRRSGDCVSFSHLYQQASRYLQRRGFEVANAPCVSGDSTSVLRDAMLKPAAVRWAHGVPAIGDCPKLNGQLVPAPAEPTWDGWSAPSLDIAMPVRHCRSEGALVEGGIEHNAPMRALARQPGLLCDV